MAVNGVVVACEIVSDDSEAPARIRLWNDNQFAVSWDTLIFRSKEARHRELQESATLLAQLYGIEPRLGGEVLADRILDFEFAGSVV